MEDKNKKLLGLTIPRYLLRGEHPTKILFGLFTHWMTISVIHCMDKKLMQNDMHFAPTWHGDPSVQRPVWRIGETLHRPIAVNVRYRLLQT